MTLKELKKNFRKCGLTFSSKGLDCTFEMKKITKITNARHSEGFTQASFVNGKYIVQLTAWRKPD